MGSNHLLSKLKWLVRLGGDATCLGNKRGMARKAKRRSSKKLRKIGKKDELENA